MLTTVLSRLPGEFGRYSARGFYLRCIVDLLYFYVESLLDRFLSVGVQMKIKLWRLAVLIFYGFGPFAQAQVGNPELIAQAKKEGALVRCPDRLGAVGARDLCPRYRERGRKAASSGFDEAIR